MKFKSGIIVLVLLFYLPLVYSQNVELELVDAITNVRAGDEAVYTTRLTNNQEFRDAFVVMSETSATLLSEIIDDIVVPSKQIKLDPGKSASFNVSVSTLESARSDTFFDFKLKIISVTNPTQEITYNLSGFVVSRKEIIQIMPEIPDEIAPNEDLILKIKFKNKINSVIKDYDVSISSELPDLNKKFKITLMPLEEIEEQILFAIGNVKPGDYGISISAYEGANLRGSFLDAFAIAEKASIEETKDEVKSFLKYRQIIKKKNIGNAPSEQRIEMGISTFGRIFTAYLPEPTIKNDKLVWEFTLNPGDEYSVEVVINYRSILYGIMIIIIFTLAGLLYVDRSVTIKKKIFRIKESPDGISELKILLHIKNGSNSVLTNSRIIDLIPSIIEPTQEYGTLKPTTVQKGTHSIRLIWDIGKLEPREERVITYKVKAKLKLAGEMILPAAGLHYMRGVKLITIKSARLQLKPKISLQES